MNEGTLDKTKKKEEWKNEEKHFDISMHSYTVCLSKVSSVCFNHSVPLFISSFMFVMAVHGRRDHKNANLSQFSGIMIVSLNQ